MFAPLPSIVLLDLMRISDDKLIVPDTSKTIHCGSVCSAQARSEPVPELARLVTRQSDPPAPPVVFWPKPTTLFMRPSLHSSLDGRVALTGLSGANNNMTNTKKLGIFIFFIACCLSFR